MNTAVTMKKTKTNPKEEISYIYFARAYLLLAYLGMEQALQQKNEKARYKNPLLEEGDDRIYEPMINNRYILAPSLFNIKHAIEVFLKSTALLLEESIDYTHDIGRLFSNLKEKLPISKTSEVEKLKKLIEKYYHLSFLKEMVGGNFIIEDIKNDVFRFPDNSAKISLDFEEILPRFSTSDIEKFKKDIRQIYDLFHDIGWDIIGGNNIKIYDTLKITNPEA